MSEEHKTQESGTAVVGRVAHGARTRWRLLPACLPACCINAAAPVHSGLPAGCLACCVLEV
eukprot:COSAG02_NODE_18377_length_942_cov_11.926453_1_plen_60_part_10